MEENKAQIYPQRFIPGGDGTYFASHTWTGRYYDFRRDWTNPNDWSEFSEATRTFNPLSENSRAFIVQAGKDVDWNLDP